VDVVLLRWPHERERRELLERAGRPRLLLVEREAPAPGIADCLEDWIRVPADDRDVRARIDALSRRTVVHVAPHDPAGGGTTSWPPEPDLDDDGVLRFRGRWVSLPPVEARLMSALVDRFGAVVSREQLARCGWPDGAPGRNALDVHVLRLRRRIGPVGLAIKTVRSRGYLLEGDTSGSTSGSRQEPVRNA
jgi:DNA-binding response OmpR family regulator